MTNLNYDNKTFNNLFLLFGGLPKYIDLLDKYEYIQYRGIRIPRIPLDNNNNFKEILYAPQDEASLNEIYYASKKYNENNDIFKENDIKENNDNKLKNNTKKNLKNIGQNFKINIEEDEYLLKNKINYYINNKFNNQYPLNNNLINKINNINLIPPKIFISIVNDNNNYLNNIDINNISFYNKIHNIILKNINNIYSLNNFYIPKNQKPVIDNNLELKQNSLINLKLNQKKSTKILFHIKNKSLIIKNREKIINENQNIKVIKRGRKEKKMNKKIHRAIDNDNILRKIQVHFLSFTTNYINDIIKAFIKDKNVPLFKNIDYEIKRTVKHKFVEELKSKCIGEILQLRVSPKMKIHDDTVNKNIYKKVCLLCPFMNEYLQRSYISLFKEYYYNKKKIFIVNGKTIPLSIKTKTFSDLININYCYKEKLKFVAVNYFLNKYKRFKKPNFKINVINNNIDKNKEINNDKE